MAKRVVVATDFSEAADEAVRQADERARAAGATLTVFHVIPNPLRTDPLFPQFRQEMADDSPTLQRDVIEQVNVRVTALTGRQPGEFEVLVEDGPPMPSSSAGPRSVGRIWWSSEPTGPRVSAVSCSAAWPSELSVTLTAPCSWPGALRRAAGFWSQPIFPTPPCRPLPLRVKKPAAPVRSSRSSTASILA